MPGERVSMRKIRDVLRLRFGHQLPQRTIGQSLRLSQGAVSEYLKRAQRAGLAWPLPDALDDAGLEALLFPPPPDVPTDERPVPDWSAIHREMRRPNVTLALLWEEYRDETADGFGYSWFCDLYRAWVGRLKPTLRQVHTAGEKLVVDFAGHTMEVVDGATGEIQTAQIFVAVLGASSFIYAEATWSQSLPDWIAAHVNALAAISKGVLEILRRRDRVHFGAPIMTSSAPHRGRSRAASRRGGEGIAIPHGTKPTNAANSIPQERYRSMARRHVR